MRLFYSTLLVTAISLSLTTPVLAQNDGSLGSRDDIIISNTSSTTIEVDTKVAQATAYNDIDTLESAAPVMPKAEKIENTQSMDSVSTEVFRRGGAVSSDPMISRADASPSAPTPYKPVIRKRTSTATSTPVMQTSTATQARTEVKTAAAPSYTPPAPSGSSEIPPNARAGECYAKVLIPAVTENQSKRIQVSEERKVLARIIPAQYKVQTERVKVSEARKYWKQGRGPIEKTNQLTGEILCLVEEPAQYKTIEKRVLVSPEKPEYRMEPAQFETITRTQVLQAERLEWRRILCETNVTPQVVMNIQKSLQSKGYNVGGVDGRFGNQTLQAINQYQQKNGLASRGVTYETLNSLGVNLNGV